MIIIGGGIGGLTAAALLANRGRRVLLLEREERTGGYVTSFERDGFCFDATGAFVGGCEEGEEFYEVLVEAGALPYLTFLRIEGARNIYPGFSLDLPLSGGFRGYMEWAKRLFPTEEKGLEAYLTLISRIGSEIALLAAARWWQVLLFPIFFHHLIRYEKATLQSVLNRYFQGAEVKEVLSILPAHLPPSRLSFLFTATLITKALAKGVWYPRGGMEKIPLALEAAIRDAGGEVRVRAEVVRIDVEKGRVRGVLTRGGEFISAPSVVAAVNVKQALGDLLPERERWRFCRLLGRLEYSLSSFLVYLGVNMKIDHFPYFTYVASEDVEGEYRELQQGRMPERPTVIITIPTLIDPMLAPDGHHIIRLITPAPYEFADRWGGGDKSRYREIKLGLANRLIRLVEERCLSGLGESIKVMEAATPLTLERYTANEAGASYGLAPTPDQIGRGRPANRTAIKGLYLAGHYSRPAHGIVGAALSGRFVADLITKEKG